MLDGARLSLILLNVVGGIAVLGSYAYGLAGHPGRGEQLWGGVPLAVRPLYTASMLAAAAGYFAFTYFVVFCAPAERSGLPARFGYQLWSWIYAGILLPSALWLPLTFRMIEQGGDALWLTIRGVLMIVGLSSLALVATLVTVEPGTSALARRVAIAGALAFSLQTFVLDALVWPAYFPRTPASERSPGSTEPMP